MTNNKLDTYILEIGTDKRTNQTKQSEQLFLFHLVCFDSIKYGLFETDNIHK
jgi:hypothetical protein